MRGHAACRGAIGGVDHAANCDAPNSGRFWDRSGLLQESFLKFQPPPLPRYY